MRHTVAVAQTSLIVFGLLALLIIAAPAASQLLHFGDGQLAFETDRDGNWEIYLIDISAGIALNLTRHPADDRSPSWSPDGSAIAFHSNRNGGMSANIFVMTSDGSFTRQLTFTGNNWRPVWSPDGQKIAFMLGYEQIATLDVDANQQIHRLALGFSPAWSPDSQHMVYYASPSGTLNGDIYLMDNNGLQIRNITNNRANDWVPAWSPDGRYIAFNSARDGGAEIYLLDAVCALQQSSASQCRDSVHRLTINTINDNSPAWSYDSQRIAYSSESNGYEQIYMINVDGSGSRRLTDVSANNRLPVWHP